MERIKLSELLAATKGKLIGDCTDMDICIGGVESDNRKVSDGDVFFAFAGEKADGHRFVGAALDAGAAGAVISKVPDDFRPGKFYVLVDDTIAALGALAAFYRSRFSIPVVAVTGSVGKTTTKDMIASVLSEKFKVVKTEGNFNNNIGLPRTIFAIDRDTQIAVVEMGMNHPGEIEYLVNIAKPQVAVITNIGDAHIGILGSRQNIFKAKCEIFGGLDDGGYAVLNGDDEYLSKLRRGGPQGTGKRFSFAWVGEADSNDYRAVDIDDGSTECVRFNALTPGGSFPVNVPMPGRHMIYAAMTAAAVGAHFGETNGEITRGIDAYVPTKMRMEVLHCPGNILIYNDTYNANPQSVKSALLTLSNTKDMRRIAVLGDMFELGTEEERCHREIGCFAASLGIDVLVTVGRAAGYIADEAVKNGMKDVVKCADKDEAKKALAGLIAGNTVYLCKASRGMALEELSAFINDKAGEESGS